ncbi:methyltransferase [Thiopseudomonas acetoxidans]|uniref:Methyltransferase n=1 Tax=Thiopseudomonas acetoxidans TaxID=3041622 RepID=A0ABT7SKN2_9GAMM|nr:methyltransferase [Thiopseudomonas sp. CY1220]MDM7856750.1 methyltransferase [Thiopseudomonas sp. CY1220]
MTTSPLSLAQQFDRLDAILNARQDVWRAQPFMQRTLAWEKGFPELAHWLRRRSLAEAERDHLHPEQLAAPAPFQQWVNELAGLTALDSLPLTSEKTIPKQMHQGIPGRKWQQIEAFAQCLNFSQPPQHWLDWCAGKGYLGRYLAYPTTQLSIVEQNETLCAEAQRLNELHNIAGYLHPCDALSAAAKPALAQTDSWVALHACGDLHTHLLRQVQQHNVQRIAVAPCCYNRINTENYQPLSRIGQAARLQLTRTDLALPLQSTVTAGARDKRLRDQAMAWRLAFDELQRQWRGVDEYLPIHSVASRWIQQNFAHWCAQVAQLKGLTVPSAVAWAKAEQRGWQRLAQVRNLELVQCLYRRALELWLLLDLALYLQEQGFSVKLGQFCVPELTPRNGLIIAERSAQGC